MTAILTTPVIIRPAFPIPSEAPSEVSSQASSPTKSDPSTPASSPPESPIDRCPTQGTVTRFPTQPLNHLRASTYPLHNSLPKSKTNRLRRQEQQWQHTPSTTIQVPPWYTTERAHIQPLRLRIPHSSYTAQNQNFHQQQGKTKTSGALCLMPNASPYPRAEKFEAV